MEAQTLGRRNDLRTFSCPFRLTSVMRAWRGVVFVLASFLLSEPLFAKDPVRGPEMAITRAAGPIKIDGDLSDPGWVNASKVEVWFETNRTDNTPAPVRNVGYLTYDNTFFYAAFEFDDPEPGKIRAFYSDRDNLSGVTDYGGVILDTKGDWKTALLFLANPLGLQYDAVSDDMTGNEISSPDFFWDTAGKITDKGWQMEIRIPFSSLRYEKADIQKWNILLYRNYPRDFRFQMFSARLPKDENCFVCHASPLTGLTGLPSSGSLVAAPYATARQEGVPRDGPGSSIVTRPVEFDAGLDLKWTPDAMTALDVAINPDFSQIESDTPQISANERFALFYPEKRPFFLEGVELLSSPIQAVHTRTITSPRWGLRGTGKYGSTSYTALVTQDRGGGTVIIPGPYGSSFAQQDFSSIAALGRVRHDIGNNFVSLLMTDREISGGGHNRVFGPDFQWRPTAQDTLTGQLLYSWSLTPNRPDLAEEWNGQALGGHAADVWYCHTAASWDLCTEYKDFGAEFRADDGFVPQAGFRENYFEAGYTVRPQKGVLSRVRSFVTADYSAEPDGTLIFSQIAPGIGLDGILSSSSRLRVAFDRVRVAGIVIPRTQLLYTIQFSPSRVISQVTLSGFLGEDIDFSGARPGHGGRVTLSAAIRPSRHLDIRLDGDLRWLNVKPSPELEETRLFTAQVERIKATYTFNARSFLRFIGQYVRTDEYAAADFPRTGGLDLSLLFGYRLNWQTVFFLGFGDARAFSSDQTLEKAGRQLFLKVSYAFQK